MAKITRTQVSHIFVMERVSRDEEGKPIIVTEKAVYNEYNTEKARKMFEKDYGTKTPATCYRSEQLREMSDEVWLENSVPVGEEILTEV